MTIQLHRTVGFMTLVMASFATAVCGQNVVGPTDFQTCSTTVTLNNSNGGSLSCSSVIDGNISGTAGTFNEFTGQVPGALYRFEFVQDFDLSDFYLWNDRGAADSGIDDFELTFYDSATSFISSYQGSASLPFKGSSPVPEIFNLGSTVANVRFVDMEVLTTLQTGPNTQYREIAFNAVPEPSSMSLMGIGLLLACRRRRFA